ncbi:apolipoprotein N-acyltransferase [Pelomonas sp. KK5]|uniref:apolipoprotein N-acyltransferase n=1 Tax=Pelomonas sp. KK5 TaxID=1855730 RepID=UPI00097C5507|nr:apolipoprotein N-acyltransferase [Pelomonas sp. KK5]
MRSKWALALACAAGVVHTAAFAPTFLWWLQILALAGLFALAWEARPRRAALLGGAFGLGWLASGLWWLYISMHDFGGIPAPLAVLAVVLLALFLCLYYAGAMALAALFSGTLRVPVFAAAWLLAELARATWFSGFPWLASGYAHTVGPLSAWAPWIGVYGIAALAAACAAALASRSWRAVVAMVVVVGAGAALPDEFTRSSGHLRVSLLQPNVRQDEKFDRDLIEGNLERLAQQIEAARGQLVVTPESVAPLPLEFLEPAYVQRLQRAAQQRPLLLGTFLGNEREGYVNSMLAFGTAQPYDYGKRHLLPFGEFVPTGFRWFVDAMGIPMQDQARGRTQAPLVLEGQRLRPLICYEDLFGEDFVDSMVGPDAATVLVNTSNLAWFGRWMIQDQHLQFSQMRALEFQRPFIRSTNTGATAVLDHHGRVTARLDPLVPGILEAEVEGRSGSTPYARWLAVCGLWPLWGLALAMLGLAASRRRAP